jgi:hypothetical protein
MLFFICLICLLQLWWRPENAGWTWHSSSANRALFLSVLVRGAVTKEPEARLLQQFWGLKVQDQALVGLACPVASLLGLYSCLVLCNMSSVHISFTYKDTIQVRSEPILIVSL